MRDAGEDYNNYKKPKTLKIEEPAKNETIDEEVDLDVDEVINPDGSIDKIKEKEEEERRLREEAERK